MKTIRTFLNSAFLILIVTAISCTKDGEIGPMGLQGEQGISGPEGAPGEDGEHGNANVQNFIFNISTDTEVDTSIGITMPELTQDVIDNDVILGYIRFSDDVGMIPLPASNIIGGGYAERFSIYVHLIPGLYSMLFTDSAGNIWTPYSGQIEVLKVVIIESTNTTTTTTVGNSSKQIGRTSGKRAALAELSSNHIDINDYKAVCDYYGLEY